MTSLLLGLALMATPGTAAPLWWTITHETSSGSDVGNGVIHATEDVKTVLTPIAVRTTTEATNKGKKTTKVHKPKEIAPKVRDAISALLHKLPAASATFSTSPDVDDEGWKSSSITIETGGKTVSFTLRQGKGDPVPAEVQELLTLVAKALR